MQAQQATQCGSICTAPAVAGFHSRSVPATVVLLTGLAVSVFGAVGPTATTYQAVDLNPTVLTESWAYGAGSGQQAGCGCYGYPPTTDGVRAMLWTGSAASAVDLNPSGFTFSGINATDGTQQAGWGNVFYIIGGRYPHIINYDHAVLWTGSAASAVDLNPAGFDESWAYGVGGGQQVGYGTASIYINKKTGYVEQTHALLWTGSAASAVDLHPAGFTGSWAYGVAGGQQVGYGGANYYISKKVGYVARVHALLWTGSAASVVDLHPAGFVNSWALGVGGGQQVGYGVGSDGTPHALLWTGNAASAVDLHPAGFAASRAKAVSNGQQVGNGVCPDGTQHALVWKGTAAGVVDLHTFLPTGFTSSVATGIDAAGNIVGYAWNSSYQDDSHAFLWRPK
jgi:probable HAF family extracellular repeat protein